MNVTQKNFASSTGLLRPATEQDLKEILALERIPAFHTMVGTWSEQEHRRALHDPDVQYRIVVDATGETAGFAILRGLTSSHRSIELKRFVIGRPGTGLGQPALRAIMDNVFQQFGAHRLWLDLFETNTRALHIYRKMGFQQDGIFRESIYLDDQFHTLLLMSILDREYIAHPGPQ